MKQLIIFYFILFISCSTSSSENKKTISDDSLYQKTANFYVSSTGSDENDGSKESPFATITYALKNSTAGDIIEVLDELNEVIDAVDFQANGGNFDKWKIIRGVKFGTIINGYITDVDRDAQLGAAYIEVHNIHWRQGENVSSWSRFTHTKSFNCGFEGGGMGYNDITHAAGSYQLYEDCYFYGVGGRSKSLVYQRQSTIYRRCIFRYDEGWGHAGQPSYVMGVYSSKKIAMQQCINIDNIKPQTTYGHTGFNSTSNRGTVEVRWMNCFAIDSESLLAFNVSGSQDTVIVSYENCIALRNSRGLVVNTASGTVGSVNVEGGEYSNLTSLAFAHYGNGTELVNVKNTNSFNVSDVFGSNVNDLGGNTTNSTKISQNDYKVIGVSGTLYGDDGWDKVTDINLFPLPREKEIRVFMGKVADRGDRGFCSDIYKDSSKPLTDYIFRN